MKISNILLIFIGLLILATLLAGNMALKTEFKKNSHTDRFYRHKSIPIANIKNIQISVPGYLRVSVEASDNNTIKYPDSWNHQSINIKVQNDSLVLHVNEEISNYRDDTLYIMLKELHFINMADRGLLKINGWQQQRLSVTAERNSHIEFENTAIDSLLLTCRDHSLALVKEDNEIEFLNLFLEDKAKFKAEHIAFPALQTQIGPDSKVELTGKSFHSFVRHAQVQ